MYKNIKKRKINLYICTKDYQDFGGKERYISEQITFLKDKFNLLIFVGNKTYPNIENQDKSKISNINNYLHLFINIIFNRPEVAIIHDDSPVLFILLIILCKTKIYYFKHTVKTAFSNLPQKHFGFIPGLGIWKTRYLLLHKFSHKIVFVSNHLLKYYSELIPKYSHKFLVLYPWVDADKFYPRKELRESLRRTLQIPQYATVFLYVGRICEAKRIDRLLGAFLLLKNRLNCDDIYCVIIGGKPERESKRTDYNKYFRFLDAKQDIENWYSIGDIFILPSDRESFCFAVIEAMACGLFPVVTDVADWKELFEKWGVGAVAKKNAYDLQRKMEMAFNTIKSNDLDKEYMRKIVLDNFGKERARGIQQNLLFTHSVTKRNSTINILFYEPSSGFGGSTNSLSQIVNNLNRDKFNPVVIVTNYGPQVDKIKNAEIIKIDHYIEPETISTILFIFYFLIKIIPEAIRILFVIKSKRITIVHSNISIMSGIPAIIAAKLAGVPSISHFRLTRKLLKREIFFSKWIDKLIVQNSIDFKLVKESIGSKKIVTIYDGFEINETEKIGSGQFREKFNLDSAPMVGLIGRIVEGKGQKEFILSAKVVLKFRPEVKFLIVGDAKGGNDEYYKEITTLVRNEKLEKNIIFTGWRNDVEDIIRNLCILVQASTTFPEALPNIIIESMAQGKPVIATNIPGSSEIVSDGKTGFLVAPGDINAMSEKILYLLDNKLEATKMGADGKKRVNELFDIKKIINQIQGLYSELLSVE